MAHTWRQQAFSAVDISAEVPLDLHAQRERQQRCCKRLGLIGRARKTARKTGTPSFKFVYGQIVQARWLIEHRFFHMCWLESFEQFAATYRLGVTALNAQAATRRAFSLTKSTPSWTIRCTRTCETSYVRHGDGSEARILRL